MKNASTLSNQDVSRESEIKHNRTTPEILADLRRYLDWTMGALGIPLAELTEPQLRAKKDSQINALREFARESR